MITIFKSLTVWLCLSVIDNCGQTALMMIKIIMMTKIIMMMIKIIIMMMIIMGVTNVTIKVIVDSVVVNSLY